MSLTGPDLQAFARRCADQLPGVSHGYPFTPGLAVYKVGGKVFMIVTEDPDEQIITVKIDPPHGDALQRSHRSMQPGRYLDKRHWVSIGAGPGITKPLVEDLVAGSFELVVEHLPRRDRPDGISELRDQDK